MRVGPSQSGSALQLQRIFAERARETDKPLSRLASGERINRAADDPAGLITSENLRAVLANLDAQQRGLSRAEHVIDTADGALARIGDLLGEAEALALANTNSAGVSDEERAANQLQIDSIVGTVNRLAARTAFNGDPLLDGTATIDAAGQAFTIGAVALDPVGSGADAFTALRSAREEVTIARGAMGAFSKNVIGAERRNLSVTSGILTATESAIRDTDYAAEADALSRLSILRGAALGAMRQLQSGFGNGAILDLVA